MVGGYKRDLIYPNPSILCSVSYIVLVSNQQNFWISLSSGREFFFLLLQIRKG